MVEEVTPKVDWPNFDVEAAKGLLHLLRKKQLLV
jgi:hypothetical protein